MHVPTPSRPSRGLVVAVIAGLVLAGAAIEAAGGGEMAELALSSLAFAAGESIPAKYTCQGADVSPPLSIEGVPGDAKSVVLVVDDPDAPGGTWDHWILYDLPPGTAKIPEDTVPPGAVQGENGWGNAEYAGPCPPSGEHRYRFKLYALDTELGLDAGTAKSEVEAAMEGHVLATAELVGVYAKS